MDSNVIVMGMMRMSLFLSFLITRLMPAFKALVLVMIANDPPINKTNATTSAASWMPLVGACRTAKISCPRLMVSPVSESV